ncbi:hypothetical protein CIPAW_13G001200 [Carya illinoinensis]|uniref:Uncharacterized protein n=1 Tax=Carya illinoinensis TaxID=32201 RepID=A0A8T1NM29_CARIL|nr:hypothetical protein CIPAW_13G001200 [Carya illinoinensis]
MKPLPIPKKHPKQIPANRRAKQAKDCSIQLKQTLRNDAVAKRISDSLTVLKTTELNGDYRREREGERAVGAELGLGVCQRLASANFLLLLFFPFFSGDGFETKL